MKKFYVIIPVILIFILLNGCETKVKQDSDNPQIKTGDTAKVVIDSTKINENSTASVDSFKIDESIYGLKDHINWLRETWSNVKNPLIATYSGSEWGDYFHLNFTDSDERSYDFGDGSNNFESLGINTDELPDEYIGKKFKIYWEWKLSSFNCCEGMMNAVQAKVPSIVKIEQLDK